ncbi:MAG: SpoIID/LytB domain-containing protein [Christensenellales bacterium]
MLLGTLPGAQQIEIGIYGSYLLNDDLSFQRGTTLKALAQDGTLMVFYEGLVYRAGSKITLLRYGADAGMENGLRLDQGLNLHEGDLHVTLQGGAIRAVLHIGIEDYLKGVVPYEMSDSFPAEALKAQAVSARSYALKSLSQKDDFDVHDNTMDQVYRGFDATHVQALDAIRQTKGMALVYDRNLAQAYYTASNGGQTESAFNAWGREHLPYTRLTPDPYDLENPASQTRSCFVRRQWKASSEADIALEAQLKAALVPPLGAQGYDTSPEHIKIDVIQGLEAVAPRFGADSLLMTKLRFELRISARKPMAQEAESSLFSVSPTASMPTDSQAPGETWGPMTRLEQIVKVELPIFPGLEQALGLSINAKDNEIIRITASEEGFTLRSGRYGHGVGMSQRGAEWMAATYGWNYRQILHFYYPGTQLEAFQTGTLQRPLLLPAFLSTPGPRPTATPRPTLIPLQASPAPEQWLVEVTGIAANSSLNLRSQPSLSSSILYQLFYGQRLLVEARTDDGWLKVAAGEVEGYVMESFVKRLP